MGRMSVKKTVIAVLSVCIAGAFALHGTASGLAMSTGGPQETPPPSAAARRVGVVKAINGNTITLTPDSGSEVDVAAQESTRILRIAPGEKNLKNATPAQLQDLQVGDRILVAGKASDDAKTIAASSIVLMKRSDVEARHEQERQDWQKRGMGGLVSTVDQATGTVTISVTGFGGTKSIAVHTAKDTVFRRYAPDSVKFDDAKSSTLQEVHAGDQLRARGEVVTGSFSNVAGTINSVDASSNTINVQDLLSKKAVQVKISAESQLHKLLPEMAQRIAVRLKGSAAASIPGAPGSGAAPPSAQTGKPAMPPGTGAAGGTWQGGGTGGGARSGGAPDLQQMLSHMPAVTLADLHKGDAVLIVATQGTPSSGGTAITLLSGVEPILQAAPSAGQAMMLTPWNLGGAPGDAGSQ
jgi:co-chaperonin GroES (HSP10)